MQQTKYAEVFYKEYCDILTKNFRTYLEQELYIDVIFLCKYNKKVPAHQIVLGSFSSLLHQLFSDHQQYFKGHIAYVCVPDIKQNSLQNILTFIYYGKVSLKNKKDLSHLYEDLVLLDLPSNVITSKSEPFCTYIAGIRKSNDADRPIQPSNECANIKIESTPIPKMNNISDNCVVNFKPADDTLTAFMNADGVSSSSSSLPIISSVITLDPQANAATVDRQKNSKEYAGTLQLLQDKQDVCSEQQITSSEDSSRKNHPIQQPSVPKLDKISNTQLTTSSSNEETSNKKKNHLLVVLKKVTVACQNLESVGVSDDECTRTNLQSCLRIVKQCIVDINDLLSTEVTISSHGNYKFIDVEKDWELKIMLDNCLETLPRLEKAIENSNNRGKRHRRRERRDSVERLDYQRTVCNENINQ